QERFVNQIYPVAFVDVALLVYLRNLQYFPYFSVSPFDVFYQLVHSSFVLSFLLSFIFSFHFLYLLIYIQFSFLFFIALDNYRISFYFFTYCFFLFYFLQFILSRG